MNEAEVPAESPAADLVVLNALEARVLGCLMEKSATTPEAYPLTLNSTHLACNQKTARDPIMHAEVGAVGHTLHTLEEKNLVRVERGARALRYEHTIGTTLNLSARARAVVALLLLRGPQTQAELFTRSERLADFSDPAMLGDTLERLAARNPPLVLRIGRASGQREDRYMHLLSGPVDIDNLPAPRSESRSNDGHDAKLEARVDALERALADLQAKFASKDFSKD